MALGATGILKSALLLSNVGYVDRLASSGGPADCPKANGDGDEGILDDSEHEKGKFNKEREPRGQEARG